MKASERSGIAPFLAMEVFKNAAALEAQGRTIVHLEAGQPGTSAPHAALAAVERALRDEPLGYTEALGRRRLREAIAAHYKTQYGVDVSLERVIVTTGSSAGFLLAFLACFDAGQRLGLASPGYPAYRNTAKALGIETQILPCGHAQDFRLRPQAVEELSDAHGLLIASPGNPTGTIVGADDLAGIANFCRRRGMWLISDEIYHGLSYGGPTATALAFNPDAIVINSFSKYFSMTGWRIGWMIAPECLMRPIERLAQNLYISPPNISQVAAIAALGARAELDGHVARYAKNRAHLLVALKSCGVADFAPADGAFYVYAKIAHTGLTSTQLSQLLLTEAGVATTPGVDFDPEHGGDWLRLSYAGTEQDIARASDALVHWFKTRGSST